MKIGVVLSSVVHVALLSWGLLSIPAPAPLEVAEVESISVEVISFSDVSQAVQGEKEADLRDTPAPIPTKRPDANLEAKNVGDTKADVKTEREEKPAEKPVEVKKAAPPAPTPTPRPEVAPEPQTKKEEAPAPTTEVAALTQPAVPISTPPIEDETPIVEKGEQFAKLPISVTAPSKRPSPPKPKSAETTDRKKSEEPAKKKTATSNSKNKSKADDLAALINKQKPTAGGSKSTKKQASLGTKKPAEGKKLSRNEMDGLRAAIEACWSVPAGLAEAENMRAKVNMNLKKDGTVDGRPIVTVSGGNQRQQRTFAGSVKRAVLNPRCQPYSLPKDKYDTWSEVEVNFSAADMFN